ncbi:MAG: ribosomal protein L7/L12 [Arenimonas sp.]
MELSHYQLPNDAMLEANRGNLIEAIKITRTGTGLGLKEAKDLVDAYVAGTPIDAQAFVCEGSSQLPSAAISAIESGNSIEAIKILRAETGLGLKEAKDVIDTYVSRNPVAKSRSQTIVIGESSQIGKIALIALLIAGVIVAVLAMTGKF